MESVGVKSDKKSYVDRDQGGVTRFSLISSESALYFIYDFDTF